MVINVAFLQESKNAHCVDFSPYGIPVLMPSFTFNPQLLNSDCILFLYLWYIRMIYLTKGHDETQPPPFTSTQHFDIDSVL